MAGTGNDDISNNGNNVTINGGDGNDSIENYYANNVTITAGAGNDSIRNSGSNVRFQYSAGDGNDSIVGFNATSTLQIAGNTYSTKKSGSNVIVTVGKGKITLDGAATLETVKIVSDTVKITNSTKSPVKLKSSYKNADASTRTKAVKITGNSLANSIVGGSGNDTLTGGTGNDSLWGGGGSDTFIYSSGKDVISGFGSDDLLKITGTFSAPTYNKSDKSIAFKVGSGSVTLRDFGTTTTFHVNSTTYQLSGGKLRAR
ncbi:MAG: calcium-binding protein [Quinella sp. 1Q7]|nr:calcium-binding protein [Quinella sp. 1Q7]